jgi:DnaK suppressor protein
METGEFKALLCEMKGKLQSNIKRLEDEMENFVINNNIDDTQDMASLESDSMRHSALLKQQRHELKEVDHALAKIRDNTYGICEASGETIPIERLRAEPHTRYCLEHEKESEK